MYTQSWSDLVNMPLHFTSRGQNTLYTLTARWNCAMTWPRFNQWQKSVAKNTYSEPCKRTARGKHGLLADARRCKCSWPVAINWTYIYLNNLWGFECYLAKMGSSRGVSFTILSREEHMCSKINCDMTWREGLTGWSFQREWFVHVEINSWTYSIIITLGV